MQGTTTIHRTKSYFDTGTLNTDTDPNTNPTTYIYGAGSCGNSFPTQITDALGHSNNLVWDCNGAVKTSVADPNNKTTSFVYGDPNFWRLTQTNSPDGGRPGTRFQNRSL